MKKIGKAIDFTVILIGIFVMIFLLIGLRIISSGNSFKENAILVNGTITQIDEENEWVRRDGETKLKKRYDVYVSYEIDGTTYNVKIDSHSSDMYEGSPIELYVDKDNYQIARSIGTESYVGYGFVFFGAVFILLAIKTIHKNLKDMQEEN